MAATRTVQGATPATTQTAAPKVIALPPNFVRVESGNRVAMCEPADQTWVHDCLAHAPPGTQPTTQPADLLSRLDQQQAAIEQNLTTQLDLKDPATAKTYVTDSLVPLAQRLKRLRVRIIYLVITKEDLKRLVAGGWGSDQFHYNRVADKVVFDGEVEISLDGADGESVVPVPYLPDSSTSARATSLAENVGRTEAGVADLISREALSALQMSIAQFILKAAMDPIKLQLEEDWFTAGVVGQLSTQTMATLSGSDPHALVQMIARPDPRNPVAAISIDLAHPIAPDQLRPEIAVGYADAFRRRSIAVVLGWTDRAGPDAIAKTFAAIHLNTPKDGPSLIELIRKTTGVDLSPDLAAQ